MAEREEGSSLLAGRTCGQESMETYRALRLRFGWEAELRNGVYAAAVDGVRDAWFIAEPCYRRRLEKEKEEHVITDNCERIAVAAGEGREGKADKLVFVKRKGGYIFLGVYRCVQEGEYDIYKRVGFSYEK